MESLDTVVVGAGIAGLYTAWRLLQGGHRPEGIAVFEASQRVGGRLFSVAMPGTSGIAAEFGGMRFPAHHRLITSVIKQCGLATREFEAGSPMRELQEGSGENIFYLRGKQWAAGEIGKEQPIPYGLRADERHLDPFELIVKALRQIGATTQHLGAHARAKTKESFSLDGRPLSDWGFWNLLARFLSDEALQFVEMGVGYSSLVGNWNAADAAALIAESIRSPIVKTLVAGMQALPEALAASIVRDGSAVHRQHRLVSLRVPAQIGDGLHELVFQTASGPRVIRALRVVLALPLRALQMIPDCAALTEPRIASLLKSVTPQPLGKVFLAHEEPWWRPLGLTAGRAITDLPIRQIYYFGTEPGRPSGTTGYVTMGFFDRPQLDYWAGLQRLEQPDGNGFSILDPSGPLATEVRRQVAMVYGLDQSLPAPLSVGFMNWQEDPYGGAWHTWNQGVKSCQVVKQVMSPLPGTALHIVGEAWSNNQGWVEGALETAEAVVGMITSSRRQVEAVPGRKALSQRER